MLSWRTHFAFFDGQLARSDLDGPYVMDQVGYVVVAGLAIAAAIGRIWTIQRAWVQITFGFPCRPFAPAQGESPHRLALISVRRGPYRVPPHSAWKSNTSGTPGPSRALSQSHWQCLAVQPGQTGRRVRIGLGGRADSFQAGHASSILVTHSTWRP